MTADNSDTADGPSRRGVLKRGLAASATLVAGGAATAAADGPSTDRATDATDAPSTAHGTIQAAVDAAGPGDTVLVPPGRYEESVTVDTPVSLVATGQSPTTVDVGGAGFGIRVAADGVTVDGFEFEGIDAAAVEATSPVRAGDVEGLDVFNVVARGADGRSVAVVNGVGFESRALDGGDGLAA